MIKKMKNNIHYKLIHEAIKGISLEKPIESYQLPSSTNTTNNYVISKKISGRNCLFICTYDHYYKTIHMFLFDKKTKKIKYIYPNEYTTNPFIDPMFDQTKTQVLFIFEMCCINHQRQFTNVILHEYSRFKLFHLQEENELKLCTMYNLVKKLYIPYTNDINEIYQIMSIQEPFIYNVCDGIEIQNFGNMTKKYYYTPKEFRSINFFVVQEENKKGERFWKLFLRNFKNQFVFFTKLASQQNFLLPPFPCIVSFKIEQIFHQTYFVPLILRRDLRLPSYTYEYSNYY